MKLHHKLILAILVLSCRVAWAARPKWAFDKNFKFGAATSAYQIEGAWNQDGKGPNEFDDLLHAHPELVADQTNGDVTCNSYNKLDDDIQILKQAGVKYYRFSLSWSRILPQGYPNQINPAGVNYYNNLINKLLENDIQPLVTIYHWDTSSTFTLLGHLSGGSFVQYYAEFARVAFALFGDRVKYWLTFNEPRIKCVYILGEEASIVSSYPGGVIEYECARHLLLAHAEAYTIYQREFRAKQKGKVGITYDFQWSQPASNSPADVQAAEQRRQFEFGLFANPVLQWDYPEIVRKRVALRSKLEGFPRSRLRELTYEEKKKIAGTYDFLGINHYTTYLVAASPEAPIGNISFANDEGTYSFADPNWEATGFAGNYVVPWGLSSVLRYVKERYNNPEVIITECGLGDNTGTLDDDQRISFIKGYLNATLDAIITSKAKVTGFFYWSLMDNFEWFSGYTIKFGLFNVDFSSPNRTRTAKKSVEYYRKVVETGEL